jgi:hypothetical protein
MAACFLEGVERLPPVEPAVRASVSRPNIFRMSLLVLRVLKHGFELFRRYWRGVRRGFKARGRLSPRSHAPGRIQFAKRYGAKPLAINQLAGFVFERKTRTRKSFGLSWLIQEVAAAAG